MDKTTLDYVYESVPSVSGDNGEDDQAHRVAIVRRDDGFDAPPDGHFDRIAAMAARLLAAPMALIGLVDQDRVRIGARHGLEAEEAESLAEFCAPAAMHEPNPRVAGEVGLRFFVSVPLRGADGRHLGALCVMDREPRSESAGDIANLEALAGLVVDQMELRLAARRAIDEMGELLRTDPLTGLPNRRYFEEHVTREIARSRREGAPLCVALLDIDHFKRINDELGHGVGDDVLREVGALLRECVRENDFVARWGGEEFVLVMATDSEGARVMLERVRETIEQRSATLTRRPLTVSVGTTQFRLFENVDSALSRADEALYAAKREGRNLVRVG